jgi:hypothetical protein
VPLPPVDPQAAPRHWGQACQLTLGCKQLYFLYALLFLASCQGSLWCEVSRYCLGLTPIGNLPVWS